MKTFVAIWSHTFGEFHGILGVYSTRESAAEALRASMPNAQHEVQEFEMVTITEDACLELQRAT